jgi:hypothetical protein
MEHRPKPKNWPISRVGRSSVMSRQSLSNANHERIKAAPCWRSQEERRSPSGSLFGSDQGQMIAYCFTQSIAQSRSFSHTFAFGILTWRTGICRIND